MSVEEGKAVVNWTEKLGELAKATAAAEVSTGKFISFKSGQMSYNDAPVPGNSMDCIVVGYIHERVYYDEPFNPNIVATPKCFAFGKPIPDGNVPPMVPHDDAESQQHEECEGCPMDAWGSDPGGGRRKACKEIRRLAVLPVDALKEPDKLLGYSEAYVRVPVMSVSKWASYVHLVAANNTVPFAVITRMFLTPDARSQFKVNFELQAKITDNDLLGSLYAKHELVQKNIDFPYIKAGEQAAPQPTAVRAAGKKSKVG